MKRFLESEVISVTAADEKGAGGKIIGLPRRQGSKLSLGGDVFKVFYGGNGGKWTSIPKISSIRSRSYKNVLSPEK